MKARIYQKSAARFAATRPALLGLCVGAGKTATTIWALLDMKPRPRQVLIIGPRLHKNFWMSELENVLEETGIRGGTKATPTIEFPVHEMHITLAHYEQFRGRGKPSKLTQPYMAVAWDVVVCDEVHYLKNRDAQRTKWIKKLRTRHKIGLSASLVAERATDLWSCLNWVAPQEFPHYWPFVNRFCPVSQHWMGHKEVGDVKPELLPVLRKETKPYLVIKDLEDIGLELPPLTITDIELDMDASHRKVYKKFERASIIEIKQGALERGWIDLDAIERKDVLTILAPIARFTRLHQVCSGPGVFNERPVEEKENWLREYIRAGNPPALVFTQYNYTAKRIKEIIDEETGGHSEEWIVGTWAKLGTAHNFQHLHKIIAWDMTLSLKLYLQGRGRCHRSGQTKPVQVYRLVYKDTVDEHITKLIETKHDVTSIVLAWLRGVMDNAEHVQ